MVWHTCVIGPDTLRLISTQFVVTLALWFLCALQRYIVGASLRQTVTWLRRQSSNSLLSTSNGKICAYKNVLNS